ncbi:hypothetical protein LCGC14_0937820 [marine sediment metagenome]|uniref:Uncharacterized protein n=1 Tax=marine sediment metagenome TaxID=412755 RepID=A0A0F9R4I4_9ZZZZ
MTLMKRVLLSGYTGLKGNNIDFQPEPLFGLEVGTKVKQIGRYKTKGSPTSSSCRVDVFTHPVQYSGTIVLEHNDKLTKFMAFQLDKREFTKNPPKEKVYSLYIPDLKHNDLILPNIKTQSIRIYRAHFE